MNDALDDDGKAGGFVQEADVAEAKVALLVGEISMAAARGIMVARPEVRRERPAEPNEVVTLARPEGVCSQHDGVKPAALARCTSQRLISMSLVHVDLEPLRPGVALAISSIGLVAAPEET